MTHNGFASTDSPPADAVGAVGPGPRVLETLTHVTLALSRHVRQLQSEGVAVPREVEELTTLERLVAAGRLQQVQVERLARFRIGDLEAYVRGLAAAGT